MAKKQSERMIKRNRMKESSDHFHSLHEEMEKAKCISTRFPDNKNVICDEILSVCKMIDSREIPLSNIEQRE